MHIQVLFFGVTAAIAGKRQAQVETDEGMHASAVFERLLTEHPSLAAHRLHFAVNQQYATGDEIIRDGDELAIFTAVSGG
jgi:molybdopterin converting factor small subunit